jgi:serine/threonine-protein kinase
MSGARLFVAALAGVLSMSTMASAQQPSATDKAVAERLYNDAVALMHRKKYAEACPKFAESLRVESGIGTMLHLADCYEKEGKLASAWAQFREAAEVADKDRDNRAVVARQRASALEPRLSTLTIVVPSAASADGLEITRDGSLVGRGQWGTPIPLDAGAHTISASAPHHIAWSASVQLAADHASQTVTVPPLVVDATPAPVVVPAAVPSAASTSSSSESAPAPPPASGLSTRQILGLSVGGAGIVGVAIGSYFGLHAKALFDDSNAGGCTGNVCNDAGGSLRDSARTSATASDIAFALGLAAVAGGAVLYFTAPKPSEGAADSAPRVGVSAIPFGREGALLVGHASW